MKEPPKTFARALLAEFCGLDTLLLLLCLGCCLTFALNGCKLDINVNHDGWTTPEPRPAEDGDAALAVLGAGSLQLPVTVSPYPFTTGSGVGLALAWTIAPREFREIGSPRAVDVVVPLDPEWGARWRCVSAIAWEDNDEDWRTVEPPADLGGSDERWLRLWQPIDNPGRTLHVRTHWLPREIDPGSGDFDAAGIGLREQRDRAGRPQAYVRPAGTDGPWPWNRLRTEGDGT